MKISVFICICMYQKRNKQTGHDFLKIVNDYLKILMEYFEKLMEYFSKVVGF